MTQEEIPNRVFAALSRHRIAGESDADFVARISAEIGLGDPAGLTMVATLFFFTTAMGGIPGKIESASAKILADSRQALRDEGAEIVRKTAADLAKNLTNSVGEAAVREARRMEFLSVTLLFAFACVFTSIIFTLGFLAGANHDNPLPPWWTGTGILDAILRAPMGWIGLFIGVITAGINLYVRYITVRYHNKFRAEPRKIEFIHWIIFGIALTLLIFFNVVT